ncbi:antibiotic biosynthesis monooxygenase family protein [Micromonospora sp. NPDC049559]|uniref:antibiotic biosynthesis monooxygenase family protein n=1 Tax=Micromonospora sp. NPDC049559 TaxID=3155923 RepID=UPI00342A9F25
MPSDASSTPTNGPVTFVNRFTVRSSAEEFERVFIETSEFMAGRPGFLQNTLLRHIDGPGTYLNIAQWRDLAAFRSAVSHPEFQPHAAALREISTSEPNLYQPRHTFTAASGQ